MRRVRAPVFAIVFLGLTAALPAHADSIDFKMQSEDQVWPGKIQAGFRPFGVGVTYGVNNSNAWYRLDVDFEYLVYPLMKDWDIWAGGAIGYGVGSYGSVASNGFITSYVVSELQPSLFAMLTMNIFRIPVVPFVKAGGVFDLLWMGYGSYAGGGLLVGGGVTYWLFHNFGASVETEFVFGASGSPSGAGFWGSWLFQLGARAAF